MQSYLEFQLKKENSFKKNNTKTNKYLNNIAFLAFTVIKVHENNTFEHEVNSRRQVDGCTVHPRFYLFCNFLEILFPQ